MASSEEYLAKLGLDTSDVDSAVNGTISILAALGDKFSSISRFTDQAERSLLKASKSSRDLNTELAATAKTSTAAASAIDGQAKALERAASAADALKSKELGSRNYANASVLNDADISSRQSSSGTFSSQLQRQMQQAADSEEASARQVNAALSDWAEAERRLQAAQKQRAEGEASESNRQMEIRAAVEQRAASERELTQALEQQAKVQRDSKAISASNSAFMGDVSTRVGYEPTGQRASNTALAQGLRDEEATAQRAQRALAAHDAALNRGTPGLTARTSALGQMLQREEDATNGIIAQRYALYDVASSYGVAGAALVAFSGLTIKTAADFESAFTVVDRTANTTGTSIGQIRSELVDLSTSIPQTFESLSSIAGLGAQLDIAGKDLAGFTKTTAEFSATAGTTVDATAQGLGRIGQLLGVNSKEYSNLGSAILYVGNNSVATEAEVLSMTQSIASQAKGIKLTADQTVALAGATASLGTKPEEARGVFLRFFADIDRAVSDGGDALERYAMYSGMSADSVAQNWKSGNAQAVLTGIITQTGAYENLGTVLDNLGITETRERNVLQRLAQNSGLYTQLLGESATAYEENTYLSASYAKVADDLNSQLTILGNSFAALADAGGGQLVPTLARAVAALAEMINGIRDFVSTDVGAFIAQVVVVTTAVIGAFLLYRTGMILSTASTYALITAQRGLASAGAVGGIRALAVALGLVRVGADGATVSTLRLGAAFRMLARATFILAAIQFGFEYLQDPAKAAGGFVWWIADGLAAASGNFGTMKRSAEEALRVAQALAIVISPLFAGIPVLLGATNKRPTNEPQGISQGLSDSIDAYGQSLLDMANAQDAGGASAGKLADDLGGVGGAADDAAAKVYTLVDYASDLAAVTDRAFEIRFSSGQGLDAINSAWSSIKKNIADANGELREQLANMQSLSGDKSIKEYFLSVATAYGDQLRAGELRGEIADIDAKLAAGAESVAKAQQAGNKTLEGNSDAAIANRAEILGLVQNYQAYINSLAKSGASQEELQAVTAQMKQEFINQATQLGYNQGQLFKYASAFDDVTTAINNVPRNITITANPNPALQALAEIRASKADISRGVNVPISSSFDDSGAQKAGRAAAIVAAMNDLYRKAAAGQGGGGGKAFFDTAEWYAAKLRSGNYRSGGYTGNGNPWDEAGTVHKKEFVLTETGTQMFPRQMLESANQGRNPFAGMTSSGGGKGKGGPQVVELSPIDRQLLAAAGNLGFQFGDDLVAATANSGNDNNSRRGNG